VEENSRMADKARLVRQRANPPAPSVRLESIESLLTKVEERCHQGRISSIQGALSVGKSKRMTCCPSCRRQMANLHTYFSGSDIRMHCGNHLGKHAGRGVNSRLLDPPILQGCWT